MAAWSGIRPLVSDPNSPDTKSLARNHIIHVSDSELVTVAGGKWTTYRSMAEDTIDVAIATCCLTPRIKRSRTAGMLLEGAHEWTPTNFVELVQDYGLGSEVAIHLSQTYGDRAIDVAAIAVPTGQRWPLNGKKIHPELPFIEAEVRYSTREEYAMTAVDMIARRLHLAFLNTEAAQEALPTIVNIMAEELGWGILERKRQQQYAMAFLRDEMGQSLNREQKGKLEVNLKKQEIDLYTKRFQELDKDHTGYVSIKKVEKSLQEQGDVDLPPERIHEVLETIATNMPGHVDLEEYLQIATVFQSDDKIESPADKQLKNRFLKQKISVERSGGGV
ncbi:hypothetical protein Zmor_013321 [Zophobas morio]|uniref:glycerol-3-phosphate dehydrogenase n=1 Tax=Zophobas morio TaxID=2755281 RepID=A0AA38IF92_9CUCU|nr:hypothetical protein Zmor_013321 [Zophobas morio]